MAEPEPIRRSMVSVALDDVLIREASERGLDLATAIECALRRDLASARTFGRRGGGDRSDRQRTGSARFDDVEQVKRDLTIEAAWYNDHAAEHGLFADRWRRF